VLPFRSASALSISEYVSSMPQESVIWTLVDLVGATPSLNRRQVPDGSVVRTLVRWPVGRLPSFHTMSSVISFICDSSSITCAVVPSGSMTLDQSARVGLVTASVAMVQGS